jgi:hypothetical protein
VLAVVVVSVTCALIVLARRRAVADGAGAGPASAGPPTGGWAPEFRLAGPKGGRVTLSGLREQGRAVLLLFVDPSSGPAPVLVREVGRWARANAEQIRVAVLLRGVPGAAEAAAAWQAAGQVLLQAGNEVAEAYGCTQTPGAILVGAGGRVASPSVAGDQGIRALLVDIAGRPATAGRSPRARRCGAAGRREAIRSLTASVLGAGAVADGDGARGGASALGLPAPFRAFREVRGGTVQLANARGHTTLLLFWDPRCKATRRLPEELAALHRAGREPPRLLVVSTGSMDAGAAPEIRSPVVVDADGTVASGFRVTVTPAAVLVDARARIASPLAVGTEEVLSLARRGALGAPLVAAEAR